MNDDLKLQERKDKAQKKQGIETADLILYNYDDTKKEWVLITTEPGVNETDEFTQQNGNPEDLDFEQAFTKAEEGEGNLLTADVKFINGDDLEKNKPYNFYVTGMDKIKDGVSGEMRPVVKMLNKEKENLLCGLTLVVSCVEKMEKLPAFIRIINKGKKPGKKYFDLEIFQL